ncbi:unnamed protein product [Pedinophyceae sp. YPF-701]|nr:unnamed protein product [Pedinophyceae sp. YPF-701]
MDAPPDAQPGGSRSSQQHDQAGPSLVDLLREVPTIGDLLPAASALCAALTCWEALIALLVHGRRTRVGDVEWRRLPGAAEESLVLVRQDQLQGLVLHLGVKPRGALLRGIAQRLCDGACVVGEVEFAGARLGAEQARALHHAACCAVLRDEDLATEAGRVAALDRILRTPHGAALRVHALTVPPAHLREGPPALRGERASVLRSVLGSAAVRGHVRKLVLAGVDMREESGPIFATLMDAQHLRVLNVSDSNVDTAGALALARLVAQSSTLRELEMKGVKGADEEDVAAIAEAAVTQSSVTALSCDLSAARVDAIDDHSCGPTERLSMTASCLDLEEFESAGNAVKLLTDLRLSRISGDDIGRLADMVERTTKLQTLHVSDSSCAGDPVNFIIMALQVLHTFLLTHDKGMGHRALSMLLATLGHNLDWMADAFFSHGSAPAMLALAPSLRELHLIALHLNDDAARHLAVALTGNTTLRELDISDNWLGTPGVQVLLCAAGRSRLETFAMEANVFPFAGAAATLSDVLESATLRSLKLGARLAKCKGTEGPRRIDLVGVAAFAHCLSSHPALGILVLTGLACSDADGIALAGALSVNTALRSVALDHAQLSDNCRAQLADALSRNANLQHVSLRGDESMGDAAAAEL